MFMPLTSATNRFSFLTKKKVGGKFEKKNRALGISNRLAGPRRKKKILQSEKGEKNKGESRGRCVHVCRAHQSSYLL